MYPLAGLFISAFAAATLLPAQSELVLSTLLLQKTWPVWLIIAVATAGNTLGSAVNWVLGRFFISFQDKRWFPISPAALNKATGWYHKYGRWSLLLSWAPVIGDPLTLAAGLLREPLGFFLPIVLAAKLARYCIVAAITLKIVQ